MYKPIQPKLPDRKICEYIYSSHSDSYSSLRHVINDLEEKLKNKGLEELLPLDAREIGYEFDSCSSYSSASFYYRVYKDKSDNVWKKEMLAYEKSLKKYNSDLKKYEQHIKSDALKKAERRKKLYEKLKKEFEND